MNETADMQRLNQYGVDGVFTNYADQFKAISAQNESITMVHKLII